MTSCLHTIRLLTISIIVFFLSNQIVAADGMIHIRDPDMYPERFWGLQQEEQQLCVINYEDGIQKMILSVDMHDLSGDKAIWIFPIPSKPDETTIDIIKGFPRLLGYDVLERNDQVIAGVFSTMRLSQVYTLPVVLISPMSGSMMAGPPAPEGLVTIHEHIEKMGLTTELITAEDGFAFYYYLSSKGFDIPLASKSLLDEYIGNEYTFVVSWISDVEEFKNESTTRDYYGRMINTVGVSIGFPTDKIYFPLKPTSIYGDEEIPIIIYVIDHVTPELYSGIQQHTQVTYFQRYLYDVPDELSSFFNGKKLIRELAYTKIKIETESNHLKEDLWISNAVPSEIIIADYINSNTWAWGILIFILSSCLSSALAGFIVYRREQPSIMKFTLFGLANFLTLIGFTVLAYLMRICNKFTQSKKTEQIAVGSDRIVKMSLIISFLITALISSPFIFGLLFNPLYILIMLIPLAMIFGILFVFVFPFMHLYYKERGLAKFVVLFSILFIIITLIFQMILHSIV